MRRHDVVECRCVNGWRAWYYSNNIRVFCAIAFLIRVRPFSFPSNNQNYRKNGFPTRSARIEEPGPWPHKNEKSSPNGNSFVLIAPIKAAVSP